MRQLFDDSLMRSGSASERFHLELSDLNELMAGSLSVRDVFRSVSSRVSEIANCSSTRLWLLDENRTHLRPAGRWEREPADESQEDLQSTEEPANRCFDGKRILFDSRRAGATPKGAAIPLFRGAEVIGVMQLFFNHAGWLPDRIALQLEEIGTLVSPVIVASMISERSRAHALTDTVTQLPNERAFYSFLEDHIAASQGIGAYRPFSVLAIDIKNFQGINKTAGHSSGDAMLRQVGQVARENLREMDFFARSHNDEFLAVLPTASEDVTLEIIARIEQAVEECALQSAIPRIGLNIGWAAFGRDGDTGAALLARARLRKTISKELPDSRKFLLFPQAALG